MSSISSVPEIQTLIDVFDSLKIFLVKDVVHMIEEYLLDSSFRELTYKVIDSLLEHRGESKFSEIYSKSEVITVKDTFEDSLMEELTEQKSILHDITKRNTKKCVVYKYIDRGVSEENLENFIVFNIAIYPDIELLTWSQNFGDNFTRVPIDCISKINCSSLKCIVISDYQSSGVFDYYDSKDEFKSLMSKTLSKVDQLCMIFINIDVDTPSSYPAKIAMLIVIKSSPFEKLEFRFFKQDDEYNFIENL